MEMSKRVIETEAEILTRVKDLFATLISPSFKNWIAAESFYNKMQWSIPSLYIEGIAIAYHKERNRIIAPTDEEIEGKSNFYEDPLSADMYYFGAQWMRKHFTE
jgi:hypothetical protein